MCFAQSYKSQAVRDLAGKVAKRLILWGVSTSVLAGGLYLIIAHYESVLSAATWLATSLWGVLVFLFVWQDEKGNPMFVGFAQLFVFVAFSVLFISERVRLILHSLDYVTIGGSGSAEQDAQYAQALTKKLERQERTKDKALIIQVIASLALAYGNADALLFTFDGFFSKPSNESGATAALTAVLVCATFQFFIWGERFIEDLTVRLLSLRGGVESDAYAAAFSFKNDETSEDCFKALWSKVLPPAEDCK